jgi:predicted ATPase/DNA-binding XRE family transcriptional regulator
MKPGAAGSFGAQLKALREAAGFTQEELATIADLSVHAVSALERGERRKPHLETVRALSAALDLSSAARDDLLARAREPADETAADELSGTLLPLSLTALLGRDADVQALRRWLADPTARLITLTGPGGSGKTRLALEVARAIATEGECRVVFVALAAILNPAFVASAIAEALGLSDVTALDLPQRARVACGKQATLLVLDNFEQILDAAPLVADLLTSVAALRVLATSRAPLHVRGEREYAVGPLDLDVDTATPPAHLTRAPAVRLFVERVRDVRPDFRLTSANGQTVTAICRRLDALPLALELAAPWMKLLPPEELLRRLAHDVLLPTVGRRDLPERQRTMNATVAWSYQLLGSDEQRLFRRLGALPGRFPIEAATAAVAGRAGVSVGGDEVLRSVAALIDKNLLLRVETSVATRPLYDMLETVRAYSAIELDAAGERDDAMEGLVHYCTRQASFAAAGLVGPSQAEWLDRVRDDLENYRSALAWLIQCRRSSQAADIVWGLLWFWVIRGHTTEGLRWCEQTLALDALPAAVESKMLIAGAAMSYTRGELARARGALTNALVLASDVNDTDSITHAEWVFGHIEYAAGNLDEARERFTRSLEGFRAAGHAWGTGHVLSGLAWVALAGGNFEAAEHLLDDAASALRRAGPWFLELGLYIRAVLAVRRGNADQAVAVARDSLTRIRQFGDKFAFVYALVPLAAAAALKGNDAWAARILGVRDAVSERTGATVVDHSVDDLREQAERQVRARLGEDRWADAYASGRRASVDALLNDIDRAAYAKSASRPSVRRDHAARRARGRQR